MKFLQVQPGDAIPIPSLGNRPDQCHVFEQDAIDAINAALAAGRPLLIGGEPGIGKSQLAIAAALALGRAYVHTVVDAHTEARDLLWHHDAVARLAEAQLQAALNESQSGDVRARLRLRRYIRPGPLWWAFDWDSAKAQVEDPDLAIEASVPAQPDKEKCRPANGCVVLIDEIDKAESDVPNGLLEALGSGGFPVPDWPLPISAQGEQPLVIITTNGERTLPDAFLRRCVVLHLELPSASKERPQFEQTMIDRGKAHFADRLGDDVLAEAARQLADDRAAAETARWLPLPGQAEYLDLLRAVLELPGEDKLAQLKRIQRFMLAKHPQAARRARLAAQADSESPTDSAADTAPPAA